ncbi:sushi domain-containing protein 2 [Esox lucius]|uniref:Sushi domain containing 2 n=1 Tax=Esox lucius TaxID=8010 RepID=A0AAY5KV16_ESOLU|nr:sushi domain-containing protein 2 [Esox lucius]
MSTMWRDSILLSGLILLYISDINGQSCNGRCGETFEMCSCRAACESLLSCCGDYRESCIQISPYSGTMMGGTVFSILNASFYSSKQEQLTCRFRGEIETVGFTDGEGQGYCVSPLLFQSGWVPFEVSTDGQTYNRSGEFLSVHPSKMDAAFKVTLVNSTQWQYYGTPNATGTLRMTWNPSLVGAETVNIELWGYNEVNTTTTVATGEEASAPLRAEWTYLYSLDRGVVNSGSFSFTPKPSQKPYSDWEMGSVRVSSSNYSEGARNVQAVWSGAHALAWHLEETFRQDSAGWALDRCLSWDAQEKNLPNFLEEIVDCPCTLAQARADTGRFHTDYGCDIEKGSVCTYHPGAVHCVRAIQASPKFGAGQQCCYDHTGAQVLTGDSIGGSTPDRAHDWGSPPYGSPPRIPGLSHWKYDVLTFYYCCLWSDNCHIYFRHRPSSGCGAYNPPRAGAVLGDPHFVTFDGLSYTFNGKGEYYLVQSPERGLIVQGRTEQVMLENGTLAKATRLSAVAMRENTSDVIEVRQVQQQGHLEVLRNQQVLSFTEQTWMDLHGVFLYSPTTQNVTVMFSSGVGVEVRGREGGAIALTVLLPSDYANLTQGLLGQMNSDPSDDLLTSMDEVVSPDKASPEDIFNFGAGWKTSNETSLFTYDSKHLLDTYYYVKHDPGFVPAFSVVEDPRDPLVLDMLNMCFGEGALFCKYDTLITRSLAVGNSTLMSFQSHEALLHDLLPVVSCDWLATPRNGEKEGTRYLEGAIVSFSCKSGYGLFGSTERTCLPSGEWSGDETYCLSENLLGLVLGTVFSIATLITMWVMISLHYRKQNRTRQNRMEAKVIFEQS